jgi:endoglucanase
MLNCTNPAPSNLYGLTQWLQQHNLKAMITEFGGNPTSACQKDVAGIINYMKNNDEYIGWSGKRTSFIHHLCHNSTSK